MMVPPNPTFAVLACALLSGCAQPIKGSWDIERMSIGEAVVTDAGFIDIQHEGTYGSGEPVWYLLRYWYDLDKGELVPDPTPDTRVSSFNYNNYDETGEDDVLIDIPLGPDSDDEVLTATLKITPPGHTRLEVEDPAFEAGPLRLELRR